MSSTPIPVRVPERQPAPPRTPETRPSTEKNPKFVIKVVGQVPF